MAPWSRGGTLLLLLVFSVLSVVVRAKTEYTYGTDEHGVTRALPLDRYPALYTGDFGDCLGGESLFNITKFDAGYYADNLTIVMHFDGVSNIKNESLMMHISVDAYGSPRFTQIIDPCFLNLYSLCPLNASVPITGWATIPVGPAQIGGIPPIAFSIPDFEGTFRLRLFANSSESEIGCFQAVMKNGNSFSQPEAVAPVLGAFALAAILASFATAAYGVSLVHMRMHHAHSLSAFVVLETLQSIFFTGALTVNWPSVCVAWWSNFAWSAGMIHTPAMVEAVNSFAGVVGNASQVGGAGSVVLNTGGGLLAQIYGRSLLQNPLPKAYSSGIMKRAPYNASNPFDYTWSGKPVMPGMPLPGTRTGLPGTLAGVDIPAKDAFLISLIWVLIAISLTVLSITILKCSLEILARIKRIKEDRLAYFRSHWTGYMAHACLRTFFTGFFVVIVMSMFQLTIRATTAVIAVTAATFAIFLLSATVLVALACRARTRLGTFVATPDRVIFHHSRFLGFLPVLIPAWASTLQEREQQVRSVITVSLSRFQHVNRDTLQESVHMDQGYLKRYGWFSARYRRTRWWFLAYYVVYLVGRAGFLGAGALSPLAQVYGLLFFEVFAFTVITILNPFEGARNTALAVWMLSISKITTIGLSIAFLPAFKLDRIIATVVGVIIIVIQGLLVIGLMILVLLSVISTWMSLTRNREELGAEYLEGVRVKYFESMEAKAPDTYRPPKPKKTKKGKGKEETEDGKPPVPPPVPGFSVMSVRRAPKIEDEEDDDMDDDVLNDLGVQNGVNGQEATSPRGGRVSRTGSVSSRRSVNSLPRGLRAHRSTWSTKDVGQTEEGLDRPDSSLAQRLAEGNDTNGSGTGSPFVEEVKRMSSRQSLRPNSPFSPGRNTPTRETLARHAEERRYPTPQPAIPDLE